MKLVNYFWVWLILFAAGCANPPQYPVEPEINFVSFSKSEVIQQESFEIEFEFKDGDGDLGFQKRDTSKRCSVCEIDSCVNFTEFSVFLLDNRIGCLELFEFPYIPPKGTSDDISGTVKINLRTCCSLPGGSSCAPTSTLIYDTLDYSLFIKDRAGHISNKIDLPPLLVRCNEVFVE